MDIGELSALAKRFHKGEVSQQELAETVQSISTSISFASAMASLESLYGPPPPTWGSGRINIAAIDATQPCLQYAKLHLVRWLFAHPEDFDKLNARYFPSHPISVLRLGNGRFAVIDGHHRLWQAGLLFGPTGEVTVRTVSSRNEKLLTNFRNEVRRVAELNGSAQLRHLPIRDKPHDALRKFEAVAREPYDAKGDSWLSPPTDSDASTKAASDPGQVNPN